MQAYQERVKAELKEVTERAEKLMAFCRSDNFEAVPGAEQRRLTRQTMIMALYADVLQDRIAAFPKEEEKK